MAAAFVRPRADGGANLTMRYFGIYVNRENIMSLKADDDASKAVQKTPNRIPLDYIESQIADEVRLDVPDASHVTLLAITLKNGFLVFGKSVPADPANYDAELGYKFAREDAIRQLWPLFAFALRCDMFGQSVRRDIIES